MGSRTRRRAANRAPKPPELSGERALVFAATLIGLIAGVIALVEIRWWIGSLCLIAIGSGIGLWLRGRRMSVGLVGIAAGAGVIGTLAVNGAIAAWPAPEEYSGDFVVVGSFVQLANVAPLANALQAPDGPYREGDTVTVLCRARDWKHPSKYWYRLRDTNSFMPADSLVPSPATEPGPPPDC